jgi:PAS domain S-box-containing protein
MSTVPVTLVVEPHQGTRRAIAAALEAEGLAVARTEGGVEALRRFRALHPRVVLVNDTLPDRRVEDLLADLQGEVSRSRACVVLLGAEAVTSAQRLWALDIGADDYIQLPPAADLVAQVRTYLRQNERQEAALRESEWRFRELADNIDEVFYNYDVANERLLYINSAFERIWARPVSQAYEKPASYLEAAHPEDRPVMEEVTRRQRAGEETTAMFRVVRPDGEIRLVSEHARPVLDPQGRVERIVATTRDVTKVTNHERLQAWEGRVFEAISRGEPLAVVLEHIVRGAEEFTPRALASILLVDEDGKTLRHGAAPSLPDAYCRAIDGTPIGPKAGSCGTAAYRGEPVIVTDIDTDPLWADWAPLARKHHLRACWSMPVRDADGRVRATFAHYYREPRAPRTEDLRLIAATAHLTNIAIERDRRDREVRMQAALLDKAHDGISVRDLRHRVVYWNRGAERLYGWPAREAKTAASVREVVRVDDAAFDAALLSALTHGEWTGEMTTRTRDGAAIHIQSHWTLLRDEQDQPQSILVIDNDIRARQHHAEAPRPM